MYRNTIIVLTLSIGLLFAVPASARVAAHPGAVFAMTNAASGNEVVVYSRAADGTLTFQDAFATDGLGLTTEPEDPLGSQNPLILSPDRRWLLAVNAGSDTISVFRVLNDGLMLVDVVPSGGNFPVSLTIHRNLVYVLNAGGDGNIAGFILNQRGHLTPLSGSTRSLGAGGDNPPFFLVSPAQVGFSPLGEKLVVTVKGEHPVHQIHVFGVDNIGFPSDQPVTTTSNTTLSFGFVFVGLNRLIVAEPFGDSLGPDGQGNDIPPPVPLRGAASSYKINRNGTLAPISASVLNAQTATCWIAVTPNRRFAYTTNNASDTISSYTIDKWGRLILIDAVAATTGRAPVDLAVTPDNRYLYHVNAGIGAGTVGMYEIDPTDGTLAPLGDIGGLPTDGSPAGMAAY